MPFGIENRNGQFVVVNKATGAVKGRHGRDRSKAIAQLDKLHVIERKEGGVSARPHKLRLPRPGGGSDGKQNPFEAAARLPQDASDPADDGLDPASEEGEPVDDAAEEAQEAQAILSETKSRRRHRFGG